MVKVALAPRLGVVHQLGEVFLRHLDRKDAVLEAVIVENVGEAGRDDRANAEVEQGPGRMFARGAAAEIVFRNQDLRVPVGRLVEHEIGIFRAVVLVAHFRKQPLAQTGALNGLQVLLGDDHVGVDVGDRQRGRDTGQFREFFHFSRPRVSARRIGDLTVDVANGAKEGNARPPAGC